MGGFQRGPLFSFVVLADTHISEEESLGSNARDTGKVSGKFETLLQKIQQLDPEFVIHLGDVTHPLPLSESYAPAAEKFLEMSNRVACPWYLTPGNHDIGEKLHRALPELDDEVSVTERNIAGYERNFGPQFQSFSHYDCVFVLFNTLILNSGLPGEEDQWDWLEQTLNDNKDRRIYLCTHYPLFLAEENEPTHYDNTAEPARSRLLSLLRDYNVEAFFSGHAHNFFFNTVGDTHHYTLPSTSILRHDYQEFFRTPPESRILGRYDPAKTGFFQIDVYENRHIAHFVRQNESGSLRAHSLQNNGPLPVLDLRMPWCERQEISSPWGAEIFERKRARNDYPLAAFWGMGFHELRIPVSDLEDPETAHRVRELGSLGHSFTVVLFGLPDARRSAVLEAHADVLTAIEVVELRDRLPRFNADIEHLRHQTDRPVFLNPVHAEVAGYSSAHGLRMGTDEDAHWLREQPELLASVDGFVFGVPGEMHPLDGLNRSLEIADSFGLGISLHVQNVSMNKSSAPNSQGAQLRELNRVAEAVFLARAFPDISLTLDNFMAQDRGYFHCFGLMDRLCNPQSGGQIVRSLDAVLPSRLSFVEEFETDYCRQLIAQSDQGEEYNLALSQFGTNLEPPASKQDRFSSSKRERTYDLASGELLSNGGLEGITSPLLTVSGASEGAIEVRKELIQTT